jgi:DNA-binding PucR family transcriptional regulator
VGDLDLPRGDGRATLCRTEGGRTLSLVAPEKRHPLESRALLTRIAREAMPDVAGLTEEINAAIVQAVPSLNRDVDVRREVDGSTHANVEAILELFADHSLRVDGSAPSEALELVTTLLRRGVDPQDLIQAYRIGQNTFWRWWMSRLTGAAEPGPALVEALETSAALLFARIDFLVAAVLRQWDGERERLLGGALAHRAEVVRALLSDSPPALAEASRALDYDLERVLTAVVVWGLDEEVRLDAVVGALTSAAGADRALALPVGAATMWVWIGTARAPDVQRIAAAARRAAGGRAGCALGTPIGRGFRRSHEQAMWARRIAEVAVTPRPVVSYTDVEALSLLIADRDRLPPFVERQLGALGGPGEVPERLRATVAAWLAEGRNATRAAERLGLHKNTVLYRLERGEALRGRPLTEDRLGLELALAVVDLLGTDTPETVRATG